MTNSVILSGFLKEIYDMTHNIKLGILKVDEDEFYIHWEEDNLYTYDIENKYITIQGYLEHIRFQKEDIKKIYKILSVKVIRMEKVEEI